MPLTEPGLEELVNYVVLSERADLGFRGESVQVTSITNAITGGVIIVCRHPLSGWEHVLNINPLQASRAFRLGLESIAEEVTNKIRSALRALQHNLLNEWVSTRERPRA